MRHFGAFRTSGASRPDPGADAVVETVANPARAALPWSVA